MNTPYLRRIAVSALTPVAGSGTRAPGRVPRLAPDPVGEAPADAVLPAGAAPEAASLSADPALGPSASKPPPPHATVTTGEPEPGGAAAPLTAPPRPGSAAAPPTAAATPSGSPRDETSQQRAGMPADEVRAGSSPLEVTPPATQDHAPDLGGGVGAALVASEAPVRTIPPALASVAGTAVEAGATVGEASRARPTVSRPATPGPGTVNCPV